MMSCLFFSLSDDSKSYLSSLIFYIFTLLFSTSLSSSAFSILFDNSDRLSADFRL